MKTIKNLAKICLPVMLLMLLASVTDGAAQTKKTKKVKKTKTTVAQKSTAKNSDSEQYPVKYTFDSATLKELQNQISVVESKKDWTQFNRQRPIVNPNRTRSAYIAGYAIDGDAENLRDVIVVSDAGSEKMFEIRGLMFPRPLENINWRTNDVLVFDQWMNPNFGGRYAVDFETGKLVAYGTIE